MVQLKSNYAFRSFGDAAFLSRVRPCINGEEEARWRVGHPDYVFFTWSLLGPPPGRKPGRVLMGFVGDTEPCE